MNVNMVSDVFVIYIAADVRIKNNILFNKYDCMFSSQAIFPCRCSLCLFNFCNKIIQAKTDIEIVNLCVDTK